MSPADHSRLRLSTMRPLRVAVRMATPLPTTCLVRRVRLLLFSHNNQELLDLHAGFSIMAAPDQIIHSAKSTEGCRKLQREGVAGIHAKAGGIFPKNSCRAPQKLDFRLGEERRDELTRTMIFIPERQDDRFARDQRQHLSVGLWSLQDGMASFLNHDLDVGGRRLG